MTQIQPPSPDFSRDYAESTLEELQAKFGGTPVQDAARKAAEVFERVRPKMDLVRELRGFTWKLR